MNVIQMYLLVSFFSYSLLEFVRAATIVSLGFTIVACLMQFTLFFLITLFSSSS
jgi:hypothetical protein